jgi:hypothetical protein
MRSLQKQLPVFLNHLPRHFVDGNNARPCASNRRRIGEIRVRFDFVGNGLVDGGVRRGCGKNLRIFAVSRKIDPVITIVGVIPTRHGRSTAGGRRYSLT